MRPCAAFAKAILTKLVAFRSPVFRDVIETEKSSLSPRSRKLFTLSALYTANVSLLAGRDDDTVERGTDGFGAASRSGRYRDEPLDLGLARERDRIDLTGGSTATSSDSEA